MKAKHTIILLISMLFFITCSKDPTINEEKIYVQSKDIVHGKFVECFNTEIVEYNDFDSVLNSTLKQLSTTEQKMIKTYFKTQKININAISYNTTANGKNIKASGIVAYPEGVNSRGIIVFPYIFVGNLNGAPSKKMKVIPLVLSYFGYTVLCTDYIGIGISRQYTVPYVEKDIMGATCTDMLLASQEFLLKKMINVHKEITLMGYSYGAGAAIATHQFIEDKYPNIKIKNTYVNGGMYSPEKTLEYYIKNPISNYPQALPFIILDVNYWNNLNLDLTKVFKEPLLSTYQELLLSKQYPSKYVNEKLTSNIRNFLTDDFLSEKGNDEQKKIKEVLVKNNLCQFVPKSPIYLYHSKVDTYVPFINAKALNDSLVKRGADIKFIITEEKHKTPIKFFIDILKKYH